MQIITSPAAMQAAAQELRRQGTEISLVPTMGCLHAGHRALIELARKNTPAPAKIVLSIFVNPIQFGPQEDFERYPRNFAQDRQLCQRAGVDIIFHPPPESMYTADHSVLVDEILISRSLCGAARPGHFQGVLTVIAKLFNLVLPQTAIFGQKDAQQSRLIQKMVRELNWPLRIITAPIIREPDGLALSSRNSYLSKQERQDARCLVQSLKLARGLYRGGERHAKRIIAAITQNIQAVNSAVIDYVEVVDDATCQPVATLEGAVLIALAVRIGGTRLIDNLMLPDDQLCQIPE